MPDETNIRIKLRTKINHAMNDFTQFANREIQFGDVEKSIFYRGYDSTSLYRFSPVDDAGSTSVNRTWSSSKIESMLAGKADVSHYHSYNDLSGLPTFTPTKSILFTAAGAGLSASGSASAPVITAEGSFSYWYSTFSALSQKLVWSFPTPVDYTGQITKITIFYEVASTSSNTWQLTFKTVGLNGDLDAPSTPTGSVQSFSASGQGDGDLSIASTTLSSSNDLLGSINSLNHITLQLTAGPVPVNFAGMRIDYLGTIGYSH